MLNLTLTQERLSQNIIYAKTQCISCVALFCMFNLSNVELSLMSMDTVLRAEMIYVRSQN